MAATGRPMYSYVYADVVVVTGYVLSRPVSYISWPITMLFFMTFKPVQFNLYTVELFLLQYFCSNVTRTPTLNKCSYFVTVFHVVLPVTLQKTGKF